MDCSPCSRRQSVIDKVVYYTKGSQAVSCILGGKSKSPKYNVALIWPLAMCWRYIPTVYLQLLYCTTGVVYLFCIPTYVY
jgi:hypothetical protein